MSTPAELASPVPPLPPGNTVGRIILCYIINDATGAPNSYVMAEVNLAAMWTMALINGADGNPYYEPEGSKQAAAMALKDIIQRMNIASGGR